MKKLMAAIGVGAFILAGAGALGMPTAEATVITQSFTGNDCAGQATCVANESGVSTTAQGSPWIIKFNGPTDQEPNITVNVINTALYPSITGAEFDIDYDPTTHSGSWTYTPGAGDPDIKFWLAKGGNAFNFYYDNGGGSSAVTVAAGDFTTPNACGALPHVSPCGFSHISFYNTGRHEEEEGGNPEEVPVPAPAPLALIGLGLLATAAVNRFRR